MSNQSICDVCSRKLNIGDMNIKYKVKARKHAFDGWSRTFTHDVDICDRCVAKVGKLVQEDVKNLCGCGYAEDCFVHCNHTLKECPGKAYKVDGVSK